MSIYFLSIKQSFFYDESFEDYSEALYEGGKQTVDDSGLKTKELIMELELSLDVEDIKNEIPFYEKMLQDLANSSQNVKNELEKSEQAPPIE